MALVAGSAAFGQALKPYRLHVLKNSAGADFVVHGVESILVPNPDGNAIAINDKGVVGGTFETGSSTGIYHGFVWFPNTLGLSNFAFPTREVIDIHPYAFPGGTTDSTIVNDVADDDALIGFRGATPGADGHAYLFPMTVTLPTPTIGAVDLHTTTGDYSIGFGVRESSPLQIVGLTTVACEDNRELHPFVTTWSSGGGAGSMQLLPIPATKASGSASDIARTGSAFLVSGEDNICGVDTSDCSIVPCTFFCLQSNLGALRWTSVSVFEVLDSPDVCTAPPVPSAVQGRGINTSGDVTGWGVVDENPAQRRAMFWAAGATTVTRPGDTMPPSTPPAPIQPSWAEAISQRYIDGCVALVGMNLETDAGLIWYGFDGDWCVHELNDITLPCNSDYLIRRAMDINRYRHITVLVVGEDGTRHLGVLTSAADFNGDLRVDATDRADLFANYCSSGCSAAQLEFDLNCDGVVDAADMALLGGTYWSGSGRAPVPTVCACSQPVPMSSALLDEETALAALGFASWLEFGIWLGDAEPAQADAACDMLAALLRESLD